MDLVCNRLTILDSCSMYCLNTVPKNYEFSNCWSWVYPKSTRGSRVQIVYSLGKYLYGSVLLISCRLVWFPWCFANHGPLHSDMAHLTHTVFKTGPILTLKYPFLIILLPRNPSWLQSKSLTALAKECFWEWASLQVEFMCGSECEKCVCARPSGDNSHWTKSEHGDSPADNYSAPYGQLTEQTGKHI